MYIGLIDQDALLYPKKFFPNLEIMKLSSYHKGKKDIVNLVNDMRDIDKYSKIYLRKDIQDNIYSSFTLMNPKCVYGGQSFTGTEEYVPMDEEIEHCLADITIYNSFFKREDYKIRGYSSLNAITKSYYLRFYYNNIFNPYFSKYVQNNNSRGVNYFIYDKNFFQDKRAEDIIYSAGPYKKIKFVYHQKITDFELLKRLANSNTISIFEKNGYLIYDKYLTNKDFLTFCEQTKNLKERVALSICKNKNNIYLSENFFKEEIKNSLLRIIYASVNNINIIFYYDNNISDERYDKIFRNLIMWYNKYMLNYSFLEYYDSKHMRKEFLLELANSNSYLKELININPKKIIAKGGQWTL